MAAKALSPTDEPLLFKNRAAWATWLARHHGTSSGVWLRIARVTSDAVSVTHPEALEEALRQGWIDGRKQSEDEDYWLQRFTPRTAKSIWSKINRDKALALIDSGEMLAAGMKEVERAKADGRWERAYDSVRASEVPADLQAALNKNRKAKAFFATLSSQNRYAVLFRIQAVKKAETRARKIATFVDMLARQETVHP